MGAPDFFFIFKMQVLAPGFASTDAHSQRCDLIFCIIKGIALMENVLNRFQETRKSLRDRSIVHHTVHKKIPSIWLLRSTTSCLSIKMDNIMKCVAIAILFVLLGSNG
jgi:hypothetical protein